VKCPNCGAFERAEKVRCFSCGARLDGAPDDDPAPVETPTTDAPTMPAPTNEASPFTPPPPSDPGWTAPMATPTQSGFGAAPPPGTHDPFANPPTGPPGYVDPYANAGAYPTAMGYGYVYGPPATHKRATTAFLLGIASFFCGGLTVLGPVNFVDTFIAVAFGSLAVVDGSRARREIRESGGALTGDRLSLSGMVLGGIAAALTLLWIILGLALPDSNTSFTLY
jgi:hypothetical protein